jgi:hypothetical protein
MKRSRYPLIIDDELTQCDSLRTKRTAIDRTVRITLDVDDRGLDVVGPVAERMNNHSACNGAVGADAVGLRRSGDLEFSGLSERRGGAETEGGGCGASHHCALEKTSTADLHGRNFYHEFRGQTTRTPEISGPATMTASASEFHPAHRVEWPAVSEWRAPLPVAVLLLFVRATFGR